MSTIGIVALSLLAGLFLTLMLLGLGVLLWNVYHVKCALAELKAREAAIHAETDATFEKYQAEILRVSGEYVGKIKSELDSARGGFAAIRSETKTILDEHNRRTMNAIEKINADALEVAVKRNIDVTTKLESTVGLLQNWLLGAVSQPGSELGPEEYAPEKTTFGTPSSQYSLGPTAQLDREAEQEENREVETQP